MAFRLTLACVLAFTATPALALNVVIANDDGLTANVRALHDALKAEGHDVIVSVPCTEQSGMGGAIHFTRELETLQSDCRAGAAKAGEPGAGVMTKAGLDSDYFYVNGTPVMSLLYGLDVVAQKRWGKAPDLVLSGPNIGQNVGALVVSSGTVSNVQHSAARGIPSIALSAGLGTNDGGNVDHLNTKSAEIAQKSVELIRILEKQSSGQVLLPKGVALNVNFPENPTYAKWKLTRIGTYNVYGIGFSEDVSKDPISLKYGRKRPSQPGITTRINDQAPTNDQQDNESVLIKQDITVSVMQVGYDSDESKRQWFAQRGKTLFE